MGLIQLFLFLAIFAIAISMPIKEHPTVKNVFYFAVFILAATVSLNNYLTGL